ncbi:MAG: hypothetical protein MUF04_08205, partial [Akkermansiaceae bacterium]|nr:hypothetical protein [Akkermansiaceae bacterium]
MISNLRANSRLWTLLVPLLLLLALWKFAPLHHPPAHMAGAAAESVRAPASGPASPAPAATHPASPASPGTAAAPRPADPEAWQLVAHQVRADQRARDTAGENLPPDFLERIVKDGKVTIPLPDGTTAEGAVGMIGRDDKGIEFVEGRLDRPAPGSFFLQRQTAPGVAGPFVGNIRFDGQRDGWKIEPTQDFQHGRFVLRDLDAIICAEYAAVPPERIEDTPDDGDPEFAPQNHPTTIPNPPHQTVIPLQSLPGATGVLYLDFDGEKGPFPGWGEFDAAPSGASNSQVFEVWRRV